MNNLKENIFRRLFFKPQNVKTSFWINALNFSIVILILAGILIFSFSRTSNINRFFGIWQYRQNIISGFYTTLAISLAALIISLFIGIITALSNRSKFLPFYFLGRIYTSIIRNTPLLVQIFIFFYVVATAFKLQNRYLLGILILATFSGAYVGEIIRGGLESISFNQIDAGKSIGLSDFQIYVYITVPQAIKRIIPGLAGQFVSLVKDSSLLYVIAVGELTKSVQEVNSLNFNVIENYIWLALLYLLITYPLSAFSKWIEKKFAYEE